MCLLFLSAMLVRRRQMATKVKHPTTNMSGLSSIVDRHGRIGVRRWQGKRSAVASRVHCRPFPRVPFRRFAPLLFKDRGLLECFERVAVQIARRFPSVAAGFVEVDHDRVNAEPGGGIDWYANPGQDGDFTVRPRPIRFPVDRIEGHHVDEVEGRDCRALVPAFRDVNNAPQWSQWNYR